MKGERIPVEVHQMYFTNNGTQKNKVLHSYVALLTEKDGSEVKAVRFDEMDLKKGNGLNEYIQECYPDWNIKGTWRLYEDDFME